MRAYVKLLPKMIRQINGAPVPTSLTATWRKAIPSRHHLGLMIALTAGSAAAGTPPPWTDASRLTNSPAADTTTPMNPPTAAPPTTDDTILADETNPKLVELLPASPDPADGANPTAIIHTVRQFGQLAANCQVLANDAFCGIHAALSAPGQDGSTQLISWAYTENRAGKPILLITIAGRQDRTLGLQLIYGGDTTSGSISAGDFITALGSGARLAKAEFMGCQASCLWGFPVSELPELPAWLEAGDALGFRYANTGTSYQLASKLTGFAEAAKALKIDLTRRLDPGVKGDPIASRAARPIPPDAPAGLK